MALPIHPSLIDPATGAPLRAIGLRRNGSPIWPMLGAEDGGEDGGDAGGGSGGDSQDSGAPDDGGKAAEDAKSFTQADVDKLIGQRLERERGKYADYDKFKSSHAELEQIRQANATELDKAVAAAKAEGISEVTSRVNSRLVASEARAIAANANFHNPADAVGLVDLSSVTVDDNGEVDEAAIKSLIADLAKERPYLIKGTTEKPKPKPDLSQGPRGGGTGTTAQQFAAALTPILSP